MNIYVGNLSRQAGETEVHSLFSEFGAVKSVKLIKDNVTGEPRGFAFVEMPDDAEGQLAIQNLDSKEFQNRRLKVNEAKPRTSEPRAFNSFSSNFGYKDRNNRY